MKKVLDGFSKVVEVLLVIMMVAMMAVVFLATVGRYSQLYTIAWSEGVRKILYGRYCIFRSDACIQNRFTLCGRDHSVDFCKKTEDC